ncbi:hypothetical protein ACH427_31600 [Streptomyces sp. NPDC020379]|uniref:hypothetical protein n=1 Tax=Streptomyces sp. NPDC020379 TaxID=3365071 RepID=UPI003799F739
MTPPPHGSISPGTEAFLTVLTCTWFVCVAIRGAWEWSRRRRPQLLILILTAAIAAFGEAMYDMLANIQQFTSRNGPTVYAAFDRRVDLWVLFGYTSWIAAMAYLSLLSFERKWSADSVWKLYAGMVSLQLALEITLTRTGAYTYYGYQPLRVLGVPFAWPFVYVSGYVILGLALHLFGSRGEIRVGGLLFPLVSGGLTLGAGALMGWPLMLGLGMKLSEPAMTALGAASTLLALAALGVAIKQFGQPGRK